MASSSVAAPNLPNLTITSPLLNAKFYANGDAAWPSIPFHTDAVLSPDESMYWDWSIEWLHFSARGTVETQTPHWDAQAAVTNLGGSLTVTARLGSAVTASACVHVLGMQPDESGVTDYLKTRPDAEGFDKILAHESAMKHFDDAGYPLYSSDDGYGMAQLTDPTPTYPQVWNWKLNIDAALRLFTQKRAEATAYLSRHGSFTNSQLLHESVSRWNGGSYHVWSPKRGWIRKPTILCDSQTGNIGWDLTNPANAGKTEAALHARDANSYFRPPVRGSNWSYFGVCYADAVLGSE